MIAVALGVINVVLLIRRSIWNYPFGIAMVLIYAFIFFNAKLYSEMLLQGFFLTILFFGLWQWRRALADDGDLVVRWSAQTSIIPWLGATVIFAAALGWLMASQTDAAAPWLDATVAGGSITAQILLSLRRTENWVYWIVVDILSIGLFVSRELYLSAGLYGVFLVLASIGLYDWSRRSRSLAGSTP